MKPITSSLSFTRAMQCIFVTAMDASPAKLAKALVEDVRKHCETAEDLWPTAMPAEDLTHMCQLWKNLYHERCMCVPALSSTYDEMAREIKKNFLI